jgi:hypothetical protein
VSRTASSHAAQLSWIEVSSGGSRWYYFDLDRARAEIQEWVEARLR